MKFFLNALNHSRQRLIATHISKIISTSPLFLPRTPKWGAPFKTLITNAGSWGWKSDKEGYGYVKIHPKTKKKWPPIPKLFLKIWGIYCYTSLPPNSCLINLYQNSDSTLGLHQDKDENDYSFPVVSISLGSSAIFKYGKTKQHLKSVCLKSGSIAILDGKSRLDYHGISNVKKVKNNLFESEEFYNIPDHARINVTLRRYTPIN